MANHRSVNKIGICAVTIATLLAPCVSGAAERPPEALKEMRIKFAAAVAANDLRATMALTHFPLKNEAYRDSPWISRAAFPMRFQRERYSEFADCLKSSPLEFHTEAKPPTRSWLVNCDGNLFYFAEIDGHWFYSKYENINE